MNYKIDWNRKEIQYAKKVVDGVYKACELERLSCQRFLRDLERQNDDDFPYVYDYTRADRFFRFYEKCPNVDGAFGETYRLAEFQYYDLGNLMGWTCKGTGYRRYKEAFINQSRGNFKSSEMAVLCAYGMSADCYYPPFKPELRQFENNPRIVVLAVDAEQTKEVRGNCAEIVRHSKELQEQIDVGRGNNKSTYIRSKKRGGEMVSVSSELNNLDGTKLNWIIADEFCAFREDKRLNTLRGGFGKKKQCMLVKISTQSDDAENKPAKVDFDRCIELLHGRIVDETYFVVIRQLEPQDDIADFSLYEKACPVLREKNEYANRLITQIKDEYNKAFPLGTAQAKIEFIIKRTNQWQVGTEEKYLDQEMLDKLVQSQVKEEDFLEMIKDSPCIMGLDASKVIDLTAESFIFKLPDNKIGIYAHAFIPKESLARHNKTDKLPYEAYERDGLVSFIAGEYIDNLDLMEYMCDFEKDNNAEIRAVCADNAYCHQMLVQLDAGRTPSGKAYTVIECPQTTAVLNEPCLTFEKLLLDGKIVLCENELFIKHAANCYKSFDNGGRMKIVKKDKNSAYRIDLMASTMNALRKIDLLQDQNLIQALASGTFTF